MKHFILVSILLSSINLWAEETLQFYDSDKIKNESLIFKILNWSPTLTYKSNTLCDLKKLDEFKKQSSSLSDFTNQASQFWDDCKPYLQNSIKSLDVHIIKLLSFENDFIQKENFRPVKIKIDSQMQIHGLLGLHSQVQPRPLVIFRLGVFGESLQFQAEKFLARILFSDLDMNVLIVSNSLSDQALVESSNLVFGGFYEAYENMRLAEIVRSSQELAPIITDLKLVGASLSGNGVLISAGMNEVWQKGPLYDHFLALCPVVDLKSTIDDLTQPGIYSRLLELRTKYRLKKSLEKYSFLVDEKAILAEPFLIQRIYKESEKNYTFLFPILDTLLKSSLVTKNFTLDNNATNWLKLSQKPVFILSTNHDALVNVKLNTEKLQQEKLNSNIGIMIKDAGHHCSLPVTVAWPFLVKLIRESLSY